MSQENKAREAWDPPQGVGTGSAEAVDGQLLSLDDLLRQLDDSSCSQYTPQEIENRILAARLGLASGIFAALRAKHGPTADHSLRVALICSAWAEVMGLPATARDEIEIGALLHDIGKIGVPDEILRHPSALSREQAAIAQQATVFGLGILAHCVPDNLLVSIAHTRAWYDGSRREFPLKGDKIPAAARMIHIVDAYDSMTSDTVYRKALPIEHALGELVRHADTQFDRRYVKAFATAHLKNQLSLRTATRSGWFASLTADRTNALWASRLPELAALQLEDELTSYMKALFNELQDGIILVSEQRTIRSLNRGAEKITGQSSSAVEGMVWKPSLLGLCDRDGQPVTTQRCPVRLALEVGPQVAMRYTIACGSQAPVPIDVSALPVRNRSGIRVGCIVILRDASSQRDLESRMESLQYRATTDALTGLANRAAFDQAQQQLLQWHRVNNRFLSVIICDIDRFKRINDQFGHHAGDAALVSFARILRESCREDDLVARYGGEEFVVTCANCSLSEATELAEKVRAKIAQTKLKELGNRCITVSFGVAELRPDDTGETLLKRADRGLLQAKDSGRNRVIAVREVSPPEAAEPAEGASSWWSWLQPKKNPYVLEARLRSLVPLKITVEKLKGFVADHGASIVSLSENALTLNIHSDRAVPQRRGGDRGSLLQAEITFREVMAQKATRDEYPPCETETRIEVRIDTKRDRDRRADPLYAARQVLQLLKSYLMADDVENSA